MEDRDPLREYLIHQRNVHCSIDPDGAACELAKHVLEVYDDRAEQVGQSATRSILGPAIVGALAIVAEGMLR